MKITSKQRRKSAKELSQWFYRLRAKEVLAMAKLESKELEQVFIKNALIINWCKKNAPKDLYKSCKNLILAE